MPKPTLLVVIPTYGAFDYAADAVRTALRYTAHHDAHVFLVDDASPDADGWEELVSKCDASRVSAFRFPENGGLTRSWNRGVAYAAAGGFEVCAVANSDLLFAPAWDWLLQDTLSKYALAGPLTNTPGTNTAQYVGNHCDWYTPSDKDDWEAIAAVQRQLILNYAPWDERTEELNGFCMAAKTASWVAGAYAPGLAFCPSNDFNSKGQKNPTPLMTLNECELQRRWRAKGMLSGIMKTYVYHYRSVSRGPKFNRGDWHRKPEAPR